MATNAPTTKSSAKTAAASDMVTVACKLPNGLEIAVPNSKERVKLHGFNSPFAVADHGMTDVKADIWAAIEEHYAEFAWLKNEAVFAMRDKKSAVAKAEEREDEKVGFEPIDPNKLPGSIQKAD